LAIMYSIWLDLGGVAKCRVNMESDNVHIFLKWF
jgi:hypothetical protein